MFPTIVEFKQRMETALETAKRIVQERGHLRAMLMGVTAEGVWSMGETMLTEGAVYYDAVRAVVGHEKLRAFISVSEAWTIEKSMAEVIEGVTGSPDSTPANDHDRREAIVIFGAHPQSRFFITTHFSREDGRATFGRTEKLEGTHAVMGGLTDILPCEGG